METKSIMQAYRTNPKLRFYDINYYTYERKLETLIEYQDIIIEEDKQKLTNVNGI